MRNLWNDLRAAVANADDCDAAMRELDTDDGQAQEMARHMARKVYRWVQRQHWQGNDEMTALLQDIAQEAIAYVHGEQGYKAFNEAYDAEAEYDAEMRAAFGLNANECAADAPETAESDGAA